MPVTTEKGLEKEGKRPSARARERGRIGVDRRRGEKREEGRRREGRRGKEKKGIGRWLRRTDGDEGR